MVFENVQWGGQPKQSRLNILLNWKSAVVPGRRELSQSSVTNHAYARFELLRTMFPRQDYTKRGWIRITTL